MSVEYGRRGLVGILTPQANTTVEPEFAILLPPGIAAITARMVSGASDMHDRLDEYFERLGEWPAQFANAPVDVIAVACTGASYLFGADRENALVQAVSTEIGKPIVTSGLAVVAALRALEARRVSRIGPPSGSKQRALWKSARLEAPFIRSTRCLPLTPRPR